MLLTLGGASTGGVDHHLKNALTCLLHGFCAVHHTAAVDVHVVFLALPQSGVGSELERRARRAAIGRPTAGGEANQIGAPRHLPCGRDRVITGRVHVDKTSRRDGLGKLKHIHQVGGAAFGDGAQAFFQNGRQAPGFVASRRVVVHLHVVAPGVGLPPGNARQQFIGYVRTHGATGEQMLAAINFGRFRQHRSATMAHQQVHRSS